MRVDGGRPTSRGLPPAAFWEAGFGGADVALGNAGNAKFGGSAVLACFAVPGVAEFGAWEIEIRNLGAFGGFGGERLLT